MRRISVENVRLGTILARAVYDEKGTLLLDAGTVLDVYHMPLLARLGAREVLIQDPRVDDIIIVPLISEALEAQAVRLMHLMLDGNTGKTANLVKLDLLQLDRIVKDMVQGLYTTFMGELNMDGCLLSANYNYIHPVKTAGLALFLAKELGLSRQEIISLGKAALLQNIGYISVPEHVLANMDESVAETISAEYRAHPEFGTMVIKQQGINDEKVLMAVSQHHERWDGSGFPKKLRGGQIHFFARLIAIADAYYSLVSRRPGRQPYSSPEAAEFITAYSGELFDPELVQLFIRSVPFYTRGMMVKLDTGESGVVTDPNTGYIGRPTLRILYDGNGNEKRKTEEINLTQASYQNKMVVEILTV